MDASSNSEWLWSSKPGYPTSSSSEANHKQLASSFKHVKKRVDGVAEELYVGSSFARMKPGIKSID